MHSFLCHSCLHIIFPFRVFLYILFHFVFTNILSCHTYSFYIIYVYMHSFRSHPCPYIHIYSFLHKLLCLILVDTFLSKPSLCKLFPMSFSLQIFLLAYFVYKFLSVPFLFLRIPFHIFLVYSIFHAILVYSYLSSALFKFFMSFLFVHIPFRITFVYAFFTMSVFPTSSRFPSHAILVSMTLYSLS